MNSEQNAILDTLVVVPLSTQPFEIWPLRVAVQVPGGKRSYAVLPCIRQVSKRRITQTVGLLLPPELERIDGAPRTYLND